MFTLGVVELAIVAVMLLLPLAIIGGIVALVVWLVRNNQGGVSSASVVAKQDPLEILKLRYAKGELTREQFEAMRRDLGV